MVDSDLEDRMKANPTDRGAIRLLGRAHDVEAFASDCARCPTRRDAVEAFVDRP